MGRPEHADDRVKIRADLKAGSTKGGDETDIVVAEAHLEALGVGRSQAPLDEEMRITPIVGVDLGGGRARSIGPRPADRAVFPKQQHDPFGKPRPRQRPAQPARVPHRRPGPACDILHEGHIGQAGERASADRSHNTTVGPAGEDPDGFHWPVRRRAPLPIPPPITVPLADRLRNAPARAAPTNNSTRAPHRGRRGTLQPASRSPTAACSDATGTTLIRPVMPRRHHRVERSRRPPYDPDERLIRFASANPTTVGWRCRRTSSRAPRAVRCRGAAERRRRAAPARVRPLAPRDRRGVRRGVTIKERLHKLVDELSDREADEALRYIAERRSDPVVAAFRDAPVDDEPVTSADEQALAEVQADRDAGVGWISIAEIKRLHGQAECRTLVRSVRASRSQGSRATGPAGLPAQPV